MRDMDKNCKNVYQHILLSMVHGFSRTPLSRFLRRQESEQKEVNVITGYKPMINVYMNHGIFSP